MVSVRQLAKQTNVSITTVSRALNNDPEISAETRERILKAANAAGYVASVGKRVTTTIGLVFTETEMCWSDYDAALMGGIMRGVAEQKFDVTVVHLPRDKDEDETYTQFFMRKGLRGIIVRTSERCRHICQQIADEGFPIIVVAERLEGTNVNFVGYDSRGDSRRAVEHLIHLGHRRIALGLQSDRDRDHLDRLDGYHQALTAAGIPIDEELIVPLVPDLTGGANAITRIMSMPEPPTAIYFTDPPAAVGALRRALEMGMKIPDDLSIVGFDDSDVRRRVFPTLTAVCQNAASEGFEAALWLTRRLVGQAPEKFQKVAATFFEINQTTGAVPRHRQRILPDGTRMDLSLP